MNYLALYRKYRPNAFSSLVGQNEIKKILSSAVENNMISHAYLFSGPRGTGKTSTAKIFAKMVNCCHLINGEPCNKCDSCLNLFNSNDIIEIDAASNNGVDEIRDLREKANLVPSICKYKVYIIDEVHMLTTQAFNALLKILEEPPKHVIFILATTEYHKIPLTITSRCQKFQFNKLDIEEIVSKLKEISLLENISISDDALYEIARISDGGMRDSINFLDQIRSFSNKEITVDDVYSVYGSVSFNDFLNLFVDIKSNNIEKVVAFFEQMNIEGKSFSKFFDDMLNFLKDVILYKKNVSLTIIKSRVEYIKKIENLYSLKEIYMLIELINSLLDKLRYVSQQTIFVITNFLLFMDKISNVDIDNNVNSVNNNVIKDVNEEYDLAFNFAKKDDDKTYNDDIDINVSKESVNKKYDEDVDKNIIINNTFATASKKNKLDLQQKFSTIGDYLTDKRYAKIVSLLVDTSLEVVGDGYLILAGKYDGVVNNIKYNYNLCKEFLDMYFQKNFRFVVLTLSEWDDCRDNYIKNINMGKKYNLIELQESIVNTDVNEKEITVVDKLFDLVGNDVIEFK